MEQSERYWCETCERIHLDECAFLLLDNRGTPDMLDPVRRVEENSYSSAEGSSVAIGSSGSSHNLPLSQVTEDLPALPYPTSTTPWGATSDNVHHHKRGECPLCCVSSSTPSGSGNSLDKNSENPDNQPPSLAPAGPTGRQESSSANSLPYGIIWQVCGYCGALLGAQLGPAKDDGLLSHGACRPCFRELMGFEYVPVILLIPTALLSWMTQAVQYA